MEFLTVLKDTPLPTILVIGGIIFLFLGIATIKKPIVIDVTPSSRKTALLVGIVLVGGGVYLMIQPNPETSTAIETITPVPITEAVAAPTVTLGNITPTSLSITSTEDLSLNQKNLVITEVLGNPCGADSRNEFVELYNSGDKDIDTSGLWMTDGEEAERIISWGTRYSSINLGAVINTTIIPPHGFALILPPGYPFVDSGRVMPYTVRCQNMWDKKDE